MPMTSLFFIYRSFHPPHPPSFPTRRSSDLGRARDRSDAPAARARDLVAIQSSRRRHANGEAVTTAAPPSLPTSTSLLRMEHRSEEHTSELQSRQHLVCRLLLEKKKPIIIPS